MKIPQIHIKRIMHIQKIKTQSGQIKINLKATIKIIKSQLQKGNLRIKIKIPRVLKSRGFKSITSEKMLF